MAKKGLGRGLDALFGAGDAMDIVEPSAKEASQDSVKMLKISEIVPNRLQPRRNFDEDALAELSDSIREHGVITPIIVKKSQNGFYEIVAGERRWRASKMAGKTKIPAIVMELTDIKAQEIALVENLKRQDLNPVEEAMGYKKLMDDFSLTQEAIATKMGKSRSSVANSVRLLALCPMALELLKAGVISAGHAKVIVALDKKRQEEIAIRIADEGLSVRATEQLANEKEVKKAPKKKKPDLNRQLAFDEIEKKVSQSLGANVKINDKGNKGTVKIEYYSSEELEKIIKILSKK